MSECAFYDPTPADRIVGRGGYGTVYNTPGKQCVVKVSRPGLACSELRHEYEMTVTLQTALSTVLTSTEKKFIGIIRPSKFGACSTNSCCFTMQYLRPLVDRDGIVTQAYLALPNHSKKIHTRHEVRGMYRGVGELRRILREKYGMDVKSVAYYRIDTNLRNDKEVKIT